MSGKPVSSFRGHRDLCFEVCWRTALLLRPVPTLCAPSDVCGQKSGVGVSPHYERVPDRRGFAHRCWTLCPPVWTGGTCTSSAVQGAWCAFATRF